MQTMVIYGARFERGRWREWEHICSADEIDAVLDSAMAKAADQGRPHPAYQDFLDGSRYIFDVAYGPREAPAVGDLFVYGVRVDHMLIGDFEELKEHFARS